MEPDGLRVSTHELFFDLVFLFTLTQIIGLLVVLVGALRVERQASRSAPASRRTPSASIGSERVP